MRTMNIIMLINIPNLERIQMKIVNLREMIMTET